MPATIMSIQDLLSKKLRVPGYQRPYRWRIKNVEELLDDIDNAISMSNTYADHRYRVGSIILHNNVEDGYLDIVDGQQRLLSLVLLLLCLDEDSRCPLLETSTFANRETQANLHNNYEFVREWVSYQGEGWQRKALASYARTIEAVVIRVDRIEEAFQLFDSQNTRGRELDPHDLLKAYHLRAMRNNPYEMRHVVTRWEEFPSLSIRELFARILFPVLNWKLKEKARPFNAREIDVFKGVAESSGYTYALRARRAAPCFEIGEPFVEGEDFFHMVEHYMRMQEDVELEVKSNPRFGVIKDVLEKSRPSSGYQYACNLFLCVLIAYYDRFHNFDERAVTKLFVWAFMVRVDMTSLGFDSINKYAVGEDNGRFTNKTPMFMRIARARSHTEIAGARIEGPHALGDANEERRILAQKLLECSGGGML